MTQPTGPRLEGVTLGGPDLSDVRMKFSEQTFLEEGEQQGQENESEQPQHAPSREASQDPSRYEAALPLPDPLTAQQFMPVLTPEHFTTLLTDIRAQLESIPEERQRAALTTHGRLLETNIEQYYASYRAAHQRMTQVLAETGVGVREAWGRQQDHLRFMNEATHSVEQEYAQATTALEQARAVRFKTLTQYGITPHTKEAEGLFQQVALAQLAQEGHPIRPPEQKSGSKKIFNAFAVFSKFFVGLLSGVSINLLFNPESRLYLTLIALTAGVMFSVLLLWLVDELSFRAKLAQRTPHMSRPWTYTLGILAVSAIYFGVEGFLNWDGILRVSQEIAANAQQQGQLTDLSAPEASAGPQHWSLLAFTLGLVSMAVGAAVIQGRERARSILEHERLAARVASLKLGGQFSQAAFDTDLVNYLEQTRAELQPPREVVGPDHARLNERVLGHWEQERDAQVRAVSTELIQQARQLQEALEDYAERVLEARYPRGRRFTLGGR